MVDLAPRLDDPNIVALLAYSVGFPTPEKLQAITARYRTDVAWILLGVEVGEAVVGCIGIELNADTTAVIRHIAVAPQHRGRGIGRMMIETVCAQHQLRQLSAETDVDAVSFYKRCGFVVTSLGELYPGTERFWCMKSISTGR